MKNFTFFAVLALSVIFTGCVAPNYGYRNYNSAGYRANPTYNYPPRGYDGTVQGARTQREWAQTEAEFARAEQQRAYAAQQWVAAEQQRAYTERERLRAQTDYIRDLGHAAREWRDLFRGRRW
jgi:hypothetical protein